MSRGSICCFITIAMMASFTPKFSLAKELPCLVVPQVVLTIGTPVVGVLNSVAVTQGDVVKEGDVLATLESSLEQAEVALATAKHEMEAEEKTAQMKAEFSLRKSARAKNLGQKSAMAQHEVDEAETEERLSQLAYTEVLENKRVAQLELERARAALQLRTVRSPIAGVVLERFLSPGELVKQAPIMKLARLDPLLVEVLAPVSWLGRVRPGMQGEVRLEWELTGLHQARVTVVNPVVNSVSGTFQVMLELPNPDNRIPAGLSCSVRFAGH
ncbi:MAG: efflux RND transporter periplasmic adaptor subunit [Nitrospira sp.]|nr:efflux RND transporter periplasmic adaptor subunit [Nitrospira sp.]